MPRQGHARRGAQDQDCDGLPRVRTRHVSAADKTAQQPCAKFEKAVVELQSLALAQGGDNEERV